MIVQSTVGGRLIVPDLNVIVSPGLVIDLSFRFTPEELEKSRDLRSALNRRLLQVVSPASSTSPSPSEYPYPSYVRLGVFCRDTSYTLTITNYLKRDIQTRLRVARSAPKEFLTEILAVETTPVVRRIVKERLSC